MANLFRERVNSGEPRDLRYGGKGRAVKSGRLVLREYRLSVPLCHSTTYLPRTFILRLIFRVVPIRTHIYTYHGGAGVSIVFSLQKQVTVMSMNLSAKLDDLQRGERQLETTVALSEIRSQLQELTRSVESCQSEVSEVKRDMVAIKHELDTVQQVWRGPRVFPREPADAGLSASVSDNSGLYRASLASEPRFRPTVPSLLHLLTTVV